MLEPAVLHQADDQEEKSSVIEQPVELNECAFTCDDYDSNEKKESFEYTCVEIDASGINIQLGPASGKGLTVLSNNIPNIDCGRPSTGGEDYTTCEVPHIGGGVSGCSASDNCVNHLNQINVNVNKGDRVSRSADRTAGGDDGCYHVPPVILDTLPFSTRVLPRHTIGGLQSQMNINLWNYYLDYECEEGDQVYLRDGIQHGFPIIDDDAEVTSYYCENYASAVSGLSFEYVDSLISDEVRDGKYVKASSIPHCVHSLGAIPKQDGSFRPITDCRRPEGISINNHMETTFQPFHYITLDQVAANVTPHCHMATVNISAAYRSIPIRAEHWTYQGIMWQIEGELVPL